MKKILLNAVYVLCTSIFLLAILLIWVDEEEEAPNQNEVIEEANTNPSNNKKGQSMKTIVGTLKEMPATKSIEAYCATYKNGNVYVLLTDEGETLLDLSLYKGDFSAMIGAEVNVKGRIYRTEKVAEDNDFQAPIQPAFGGEQAQNENNTFVCKMFKVHEIDFF